MGCSMATVVYTRCCLLLDTEATKSVSYESIQQAEQCLKDWDALGSAGVLEALSVMRGGSVMGFAAWCSRRFAADNDGVGAETEKGLAVTCLREWTITGAADMELAVALLGHPPLDASLKPSLNLSETLSRAIGRDFLGNAYLRRPATKDFVAQLEAAIARADNSSGWVKELAVKVQPYSSNTSSAHPTI